jgi:hypothetical protein
MMVGVAKGGDGHQDRRDAGEQDVGAVGIGVEAQLAAQAAQPEDGWVRLRLGDVIDKERGE